MTERRSVVTWLVGDVREKLKGIMRNFGGDEYVHFLNSVMASCIHQHLLSFRL